MSLKVYALVFIFFLMSQSVSAQHMRDAFRQVKSSVVVVHSGESDSLISRTVGDVDEEGLGSGVLISYDGKIITAAHVVDKQSAIRIEFADRQQVTARVISSSTLADVALLQVERVPPSATPAKLGDSDRIETGDDIFIVGAPYGLSYTLTVGRITARRPDETRGGILCATEFLQTDALINPGSSGSPVFNSVGEVVGIVSSVVSNNGDFQGVGFAASVNSARYLLLDADYGRTGLEGVLVTGMVAKALNVPQSSGFLVTSVAKDSPAELMGLMGGQMNAVLGEEKLLIGGDIILGINGKILGGDRQAFQDVIKSLAASTAQVRFKIMRAGKVLELTQSRAILNVPGKSRLKPTTQLSEP
jgi:serine protease Do